MDFLVTGGLGFIGSHFVDLLLKNGDSVFMIDKMTYAANKYNLSSESKSSINFLKADICDMKILLKYSQRFGPFDCIVNFAAESHVDRSISNSAPFFKTNISGVINLLELVKLGFSKKLIQVSTDEVYGTISSGKWNEESKLEPRSPYSSSKAAAELICGSYANTFGTNVVVTRCANNFGPRQGIEKLIPRSISLILDGKSPELYGDGLHSREWIYVKDHCDALYLLAEKELSDFRYYNISGQEYTNYEIINKIIDLSKRKNTIKYIDDRPGHDLRYSVDDSRFKNEYGWKPKHGTDESLIDTFDWYVSNSKWGKESKKRNTT